MIKIDWNAFLASAEVALKSVRESIAKEGLVALKNLLDSEGFADSPYLKDYEIYSEINEDVINYVIELNEKAFSDEFKRKMRKETEDKFKKESKKVEGRGEAKDFRKTYMLGPTGRPERIEGSYDARKKLREKRRFAKDARTISDDRRKTKTPLTSSERYVDHEFNATAPRSMEVEEDGKLRITMQREIRNTEKKVIFPKGQYQGIIKKFLDELTEMMEDKFNQELNSIISRYR